MGNVTRHMHLFAFCRVHPNEQELVPIDGGVFDSIDEIEHVLDEMIVSGERVFEERGESSDMNVEHRGPGLLMFQTVTASDENSKRYGGDGRCHRVFIQVWCVGDPEECAQSIWQNATMKMMAQLPGMLASDDPQIRAMANKGLSMLLSRAFGGDEDEDEDEPFRLPNTKPDFGVGLANEPFDDFLDFGGFDESTDKKRLN